MKPLIIAFLSGLLIGTGLLGLLATGNPMMILTIVTGIVPWAAIPGMQRRALQEKQEP